MVFVQLNYFGVALFFLSITAGIHANDSSKQERIALLSEQIIACRGRIEYREGWGNPGQGELHAHDPITGELLAVDAYKDPQEYEYLQGYPVSYVSTLTNLSDDMLHFLCEASKSWELKIAHIVTEAESASYRSLPKPLKSLSLFVPRS